MSSPPKRSDKQISLMAAIQRKAPSEPPPVELEQQPPVTVEPPQPRRKEPRHAPAEKPTARKGKATQVYFQEEDKGLIRELYAWLAGQGVRPTDSLVIRAALGSAQTGTIFLQAYRKAAELDGRLKKHKAK